jgi:hypothetical protein
MKSLGLSICTILIAIAMLPLSVENAYAVLCWVGIEGQLNCPHPPTMSDCTMVYDTDPKQTEFTECSVSSASPGKGGWPGGCAPGTFSIQLDYGNGFMNYCCSQANDTTAILNYCQSHMQHQCPTGLC